MASIVRAAITPPPTVGLFISLTTGDRVPGPRCSSTIAPRRIRPS
jgi:hypothetical protein